MRKYFGTDGVRGVANAAPLDPETLVRIGRAIAAVFLKSPRKHRILIGKDTRLSGYMIETALASGITAMGVDVMLTGPIPTPGVAYLTKSMRADAGIMISASHNPFQDNGIKIFGADGYKLADEMELEIERLIDSPLTTKQADASRIGRATRIGDAVGRYTVWLKSHFPRELSLDGVRIGFDCANGAGYIVAPQTFQELGAEVVSRGISPNGKNINAGFGSLHPEITQKLVVEHNLQLGVALDGDGDRAILVDEKGLIHDGDSVLAVMALDMARRGVLKNNTVVGTVMSNFGLEKCLERGGIKLLRASVGDRYVLEEMLKCGANLGGEQSGHTIFGDISTTGDGILTAIMVLSAMIACQKPLSELAAGLTRFPQKLINLPVRSKPAIDSIAPLKKIITEKETELRSSGRVLVRYSGTENKIRIMVECDDEQKCQKCASEIADVVSREIGVS
jgi:phosphoglucosamine mutase